jgi:hydrogenase maturation protease
MINLLIIGYGNSLRGDDGVGRLIAENVLTWHLPGVVVRSCHQLVPELVEDLKSAERVLFVDSAANEGDVRLRKIFAQPMRQSLTHSCDPCSLLALAHELYGRTPEGWLLTIPGSCFEISEENSPVARKNMAQALAEIKDFSQGLTNNARSRSHATNP